LCIIDEIRLNIIVPSYAESGFEFLTDV